MSTSREYANLENAFRSIRTRIRILFRKLLLKSYILYINDTHEIYFRFANFIQNFFFQDQDHDQDQDSSMKFINKKLCSTYILKVPTECGSVSRSLCQNINPVQDQDQDYDFTLHLNTRTTFYTQKTSTKFCLDALNPLKVIAHPGGTHRRPNVCTYIQRDRQTFFCLFWVLRYTKHEHLSKEFFLFNHAITILSLFTYSIYDEEVKNMSKNVIYIIRYLRGLICIFEILKMISIFSFYFHFFI